MATSDERTLRSLAACTAFSRRSMTWRVACRSTKSPFSCGGFAAPGFPDCDAGGSRDPCRTDAHGRTGGGWASPPPPTFCIPAGRPSRRHTCRASAGHSWTGWQNALHVRPRSAQRLDLLTCVFGHLAADAHQRHSQGRGHGDNEPSTYKRDDGGTPVTARCGARTNGARSSCFTGPWITVRGMTARGGEGLAWRQRHRVCGGKRTATEGAALGTLATGGPDWPGGQADRPGAAACRTRGDDRRPQRRRLGRRAYLLAQGG
jgi:hypothetical protein